MVSILPYRVTVGATARNLKGPLRLGLGLSIGDHVSRTPRSIYQEASGAAEAANGGERLLRGVRRDCSQEPGQIVFLGNAEPPAHLALELVELGKQLLNCPKSGRGESHGHSAAVRLHAGSLHPGPAFPRW